MATTPASSLPTPPCSPLSSPHPRSRSRAASSACCASTRYELLEADLALRTQSKRPGSSPSLIPYALALSLPDVLLQRLLDRFLGHVPDDLLFHLAALEDEQRGNAADSVALRCHRVAVHVHLADHRAPGVRARNFIHNRRHCAARAAPGCPEIHQYRLLRLQHRLVKVRVRYLEDRARCHSASRNAPADVPP